MPLSQRSCPRASCGLDYAWSWDMRPPSALLLHASAPCSVATRHHAGLRRAAGHKSGGPKTARLGHDGVHGRQAAPVPRHPSFRGLAAVGQDPPPANLGSGQLHCHPRCVSLTPWRHMHGPRMIYPRPPSTSRISRCRLRGHGRSCGSHDRRDPATQVDAGLDSRPRRRNRTPGSARPGAACCHEPMTGRTTFEALPRQGTEPAEGAG